MGKAAAQDREAMRSKREHFQIERELARRLRVADREERRHLYGEVYAESRVRIPAHTLVRHMSDTRARALRVDPQIRLAKAFARRSTVFIELGAGNGEVAKGVAPVVDKAIALDVTDALAARSEGNYQFIVFDGFSIPLPDGSADLAFSKDVVEHLHPDDAVEHMREVRRVLRPGGRYVCVTPNRLTGPHDISRDFVAGAPEGFHLREYTATQLAALMRAGGFPKAQVAFSYRGWRLSPLLPAAPVQHAEALLEPRSTRTRRRFAEALAAIKVVGTA